MGENGLEKIIMELEVMSQNIQRVNLLDLLASLRIMSYMTFEQLYKRQDKVLKTVFDKERDIFTDARVILVGGTALARCYLQHRVSYDLDFFVNTKFDPVVIQRRLFGVGILLQMVEIVNDPMYVAQLHGMIDVDGEPLRVSIVEDIYADMFPIKTVAKIRTETIEGLYHRKLRTITGSGEGATSSTGRTTHEGARQTARDLFDLYVLSSEIRPLMEFVREINKHGAGVPDALLISGLRNIRWKELMDEFEMLQKADKYKGIKAFDIKRYFDGVLR